MGPRSRERGNRANQFPVKTHRVASMGPRSRERGNTERSECDTLASAGLQWGRAHVSAETLFGKDYGARKMRASMGPRSRERGNTSRPPKASKQRFCFNGAALT